jgi:hypothetical protein
LSWQSLSGLMKWRFREEWREPFNDLLDRHLADPCRAAGIELDLLEDLTPIDGHSAAGSSGLSSEEERAIAQEFLDRFYRDRLDEPCRCSAM